MRQKLIITLSLLLYFCTIYAQKFIFSARIGPTFNHSFIEESDDGYFYDYYDFNGWEVNQFNIELSLSKPVGDLFLAEVGVNFLSIEATERNDYDFDQTGFVGGGHIGNYTYFSFPFKLKYPIRLSSLIDINIGTQLHLSFLFKDNLILGTKNLCFGSDGFPVTTCTIVNDIVDQGGEITFGGGFNGSINFNVSKRLIIELWSTIDWRFGRGYGFDLTDELVLNATGEVLESHSGRVRPSLNNRSFGIGIGYRFEDL